MATKASLCAVISVLLAAPCSASSQRSQSRGNILARASLLSQLQPQLQADPAEPFGFTARQDHASSAMAVTLLQQRAALLTPGIADTDAASKTLQSLDANGNGKIDSSEIAAFAQSQGLDPAATTGELAALDADGDGALSAQELAGILGSGASAGEAEPLAASQIPIAAEAAKLAVPATAAQLLPPAAQLPRVATQAYSAVPSQQAAQQAPTAFTMAGAATSKYGAAANDASTAEAHESAQSAANVFVQQLSLESKEEAAAQELEHRSAELRANSTALTRRMVQSALAAGTQAARGKAQEVLNSILRLETEEAKKEVAAAALRAKAKAELREAHELMSIADRALKQQATPAA